MVQKWPVVFGSDGAGVVDAVGEGVEKFKKGDEVMAKFARGTDKGGSFQVSEFIAFNGASVELCAHP
jgi:NADPH:quinone reductase-like Zn-dependent oxidoreductase